MPAALAPELGDLAALAGALVALLIVYSAYLLAQLLVALLRYLPFVGGWIADHLVSHVSDALGELTGTLLSVIGALASFLWRPLAWFAQLIGDVGDALWAAAEGLAWVVTTALPTLALRAFAYAESTFQRAVGYVDARVVSVTTWVEGEVVSAEHYALSLEGDVVTWAASELVAANAYVDARVRDAVQWTVGEVTGVYTYVDGRIAQVTSWAQGALSALEADVASEFAALAHSATAAITGVEGTVRDLVAAAEARAAALAQAAEAGALAEVAVVARTLDDFLTRCGDPMCRNLTGLSNLLGLLEDAGSVGLVVALAAAALRDPEGVADEVVSTVGGVVRGAVGTIESLVGAAA